MVPAEAIDRFRTDLNGLIDPGTRIGIAVSGGPDSMALLLLTASARPSEIEAATVDHGLRNGSRAEAEAVAAVCAELNVPHETLLIDWTAPPTSAVQERARDARYGALAKWMQTRALEVLLTAHHLDDQAETVMMRLNRGSGSKGLGGMRSVSTVPGAPHLKFVRPLLQWRRHDLEAICADAGVTTASDPSNEDTQYERVRIRAAISESTWLDAEALARSAENLAASEDTIIWATDREWSERVAVGSHGIVYNLTDAPSEVVRRIVARAISDLGTEGSPEKLRGRELTTLISQLRSCETATLRGVRCRGGATWRFTAANPRKS